MNDYTMWFSIDKKILGYKLVVCVAYIPPTNSDYSKLGMFDMIEDQYIEHCSEHSEFFLVGDFNARTGLLNDTFFLEQSCSVIDEDDTFLRDKLESESAFWSYDVPLQRYNQDKTVNSYGERLIGLCKNLGIYVVNGRFGSEKGIGSFTCDGRSVVDYVCCSPKVMGNIIEFEICDYNALFSDKHNAISMILNGVNNGTHAQKSSN
ncbi:hypothetical protein SNE40_009575 [Patella caerulea]|uniref:Endonuclease/exonuclease/phosphatase domain-containing protein n=1 Tax=Patella caerulea TaxID=87958 RepID=A0AAN8JUE5_PATCE